VVQFFGATTGTEVVPEGKLGDELGKAEGIIFRADVIMRSATIKGEERSIPQVRGFQKHE
jgi:hypothetical protein